MLKGKTVFVLIREEGMWDAYNREEIGVYELQSDAVIDARIQICAAYNDDGVGIIEKSAEGGACVEVEATAPNPHRMKPSFLVIPYVIQ